MKSRKISGWRKNKSGGYYKVKGKTKSRRKTYKHKPKKRKH